MSDLVPVEATQELDGRDNREEELLRFGQLRIYPMLDKRLQRGEKRRLVFFFAIHPGANRFQDVWAEVRHAGAVLVRNRLALPKPDRNGVLRCAGILPVGRWRPGTYR